MLKQALENMKSKEDERAVYMWQLEYVDEKRLGDLIEWGLFTRFDKAVNYMKETVGEDLDEHLQWYGDAGYYNWIDKWIPGEDGDMDNIFEYTVLGDGTLLPRA